jgi:hypothetical protein
MTCPLSSTFITSIPTLHPEESCYLSDAVEKYDDIGEKHGNQKATIIDNNPQPIAKRSNMGPRSHPNVEMKAELVIFRTCCLTLVKNKIEIVPIMPEKSIKKIDHKIARTPELDV